MNTTGNMTTITLRILSYITINTIITQRKHSIIRIIMCKSALTAKNIINTIPCITINIRIYSISTIIRISIGRYTYNISTATASTNTSSQTLINNTHISNTYNIIALRFTSSIVAEGQLSISQLRRLLRART